MSDWIDPPKHQSVQVERSTIGQITQIIGTPGVIVLGIVIVFGIVLIVAFTRPVTVIVPTANSPVDVPNDDSPTNTPIVVTATPTMELFGFANSPQGVTATSAPPPTAVQPDVGSPVDLTLPVSRFTRSTACVTAGQSVRVQATGMVTVGVFLGSVTADGIENFVGTYDLVPGFRHGGLMCRIAGDSQWSFCGDSYEFTAARTGCLEFEINDNDQTNNSGSFSVTVRAS